MQGPNIVVVVVQTKIAFPTEETEEDGDYTVVLEEGFDDSAGKSEPNRH